MNLFRVPAEAVDSITAHGEPGADPQMGFVFVNLAKVVYFRDLDLGGLVRLQDGIELWLNREWYARFVNNFETVANVNPD